MTAHTVSTREQAARAQLLQREKELMRAGDELARQRQALPTYERGLEVLDGAYTLLDRAPKGRAEDDSLPHPGMWWRRHDEYEPSSPAFAERS